MVNISFPDGNVKAFEAGITPSEIAASISKGLQKNAIAAKIDGEIVDVSTPIQRDAAIQIITIDSEEGLEVYRHSTAHLMAQALKRVFADQKIQLGIGPVIEDGFYYDIDLERPLTPEDLVDIEKEMKRIISENLPIERREVSREEALAIYTELDDELKLELINDLPPDAIISIYDQGEFFDLCRGPHLPSTGRIRAFKLLNVAGAYWRGDADRKMLQRIYGTAFPKQSELEQYLHIVEEAKKRDHRKLGRELGLFMFSEEAPGMPFYLPNGMTIRNELESFSRELQEQRNYDEVQTPMVMNQRLWEQSGHWEHYHENMYFTEVDDAKFALKPMNCPGHMLIYKNGLHSYRDLPIRISEFGQVHRHELSGALNGMMRVRTFCQDDAHIFVRPDQIESEIAEVIALIDDIYAVFGFEYSVELSTRPEDSMGSQELWDEAERALQHVLDEKQVDYRINEGDGAFYGPKIDFHITDALKRSWQCATIQLDFQFPENFDLNYIGEDNNRHRPVVIHRAVFGSIDRFIGILTEHYAGAFPVWLAPIQVEIIPIAAPHVSYAKEIRAKMEARGIRVHVDDRNEKIGYKIREAQLQKIPYMLVVGDQEVDSGTVSVRRRGKGDLGGEAYSVVIDNICDEIKLRKNDL